MKNKNLIFIFFAYLVFSVSIFAQSYTGKITKVIDGRTAILSFSDSNQINILLQYIEVPEPEQQLSKVVKDHLEKFVLNKTVRFVFGKNYSQGWIGILFVGDTDINKQMLRDGAAWFDTPENGSYFEYQEVEILAKNERRGVWGIEGLEPAWKFRAEQYQKNTEKEKSVPKQIKTAAKIILPTINSNIRFIDFSEETPKGFVVVGVGYLESNIEELVKAIKKPKPQDLVCSGFLIPSEYKGIQNAYSKYCPANSYLNNAVVLTEASAYSTNLTKVAFHQAITAFRMYKVSGNYEEFLLKAQDAIKTIRESSEYFPEGNIKNYLLLSADAMADAILVKSSRRGEFGASLSGSALLALNDKYGLNDVSASLLDDKIMEVGVGYLNAAGREASKLGIVQMK